MIYICLRRTLDWEDEEAFRAQLAPHFKQKAEAWNDTFEMPYHLFRAAVKRIAQLTLSRVGNAICAEWDEIPDGELVAPIDDDDWFSPDLGEVLESERVPDVAGYRWTTTFVEVPYDYKRRLHLIRRRVLGSPPKLTCTTNNYAIVKGPGMSDLYMDNTQAGNWFDARPGEIKTIDRHLSITNRTLGSQTSMRYDQSILKRADLMRRHRRYRRLYRRNGKLYGRALHAELAWSRPYLGMMAELMDRLTTRERS
jgi:hypothetical protein